MFSDEISLFIKREQCLISYSCYVYIEKTKKKYPAGVKKRYPAGLIKPKICGKPQTNQTGAAGVPLFGWNGPLKLFFLLFHKFI